MAGTLTISTLSDGTNSTSSTNCIQGSAKAWVNFTGLGSTSIRASYNVSSVTYVTTGKYTINFTNAFADSNYCSSAYANYPGSAPMFPSLQALPSTGSSFPMALTNYNNSAFIDANYICVSFFR